MSTTSIKVLLSGTRYGAPSARDPELIGARPVGRLRDNAFEFSISPVAADFFTT